MTGGSEVRLLLLLVTSVLSKLSPSEVLVSSEAEVVIGLIIPENN